MTWLLSKIDFAMLFTCTLNVFKSLQKKQFDLAIFLNRGKLYLKFKEYQRALDDAEKCISVDKKPGKVIF